MDSAILHYYRQNRAHQMSTYGLDGLHEYSERLGKYVSARQFTGGGACYQMHAIAAFLSAKRSIHFRKTLRENIAQSERRSKAAKKAWAKRKAVDA